jgi:8-oxo-dGTP diphosphatase
VRLLLVRHTHAGVRGTWPGNDLERELSDKGRRQAAALVDQLADAHIVAVHSSRAVRCVASVQPLADDCGLPVQEAPPLLEGSTPAQALGWLEALEAGPDDTVVACSHGDVIGGVLERLADRGTPLDGELQWPKAGTWELTVEDGLVVRGRRIAPPEV